MAWKVLAGAVTSGLPAKGQELEKDKAQAPGIFPYKGLLCPLKTL